MRAAALMPAQNPLPLRGAKSHAKAAPRRTHKAVGQVWRDASFTDFAAGTFGNAGANLYVSHAGVLQTVRRWDIDQNGTPDIVFDSTHDFSYQLPATVWTGSQAGLSAKPVLNLPSDGGKFAVVGDLEGTGHSDLLLVNEYNGTYKKTGLWVYQGAPKQLNPARHTTLFEGAQVQAAAIGKTRDTGTPATAISFVDKPGVYIYSSLTPRVKPIILPLQTISSLAIADGYLYAVQQGKVLRFPFTATGRQETGTSLPGEDVQKIVAADLEGTGHKGLLYLRGEKSLQWLPDAEPSGTPRDLPVSGAVGVAVADFNKDGKPDLAVASENSVMILAAGSDGFEKTVELPAQHATAIAVGDWNGDGWPDIAVANGRGEHDYETRSWVYWGGPEGFAPTRRTAIPTAGATDVVSGDFTGSGKDDLLFVNSVRGQLEGKIPSMIYYSTRGKHTFRRQELPTVGAYEATIADFNDDGYPDVLIACAHENSVETDNGSYIFWGGPHGLDAKHPTILPTKGAISASVADLNHDGYLDLTVSDFRSGKLTIFWGGPHGYSLDHTTSLQTPGHKDPRFHLIADLNRDGWLDIVVPDIRQNTSVIYWGGPHGFDSAHQTLIPAIGAATAETADLNGDGWPDLIMCNFWDPKTQNQRVPSYIYWGGPKGFSPARRTELETIGCHDCAVADLNKDGYLDLVFSSYNAGPYRSLDSFIYWGGPHGYSKSHRTGLFNDSAAGILVGDFDGDGWLDIAFSNHTRGGNHRALSRVFWGGPSGFSNKRVTFLPTIGPHQMATADMGNILTRKPIEVFTSRVYHSTAGQQPQRLAWQAETPPGTSVAVQVRFGTSLADLRHRPWLGPHGPHSSFTAASSSLKGLPSSGTYAQYRALLNTGIGGNSPRVHRVEIDFAPL
jgi:hypothetical protein